MGGQDIMPAQQNAAAVAGRFDAQGCGQMDAQFLARIPSATDDPRIPLGLHLQTLGGLDRSICRAGTMDFQAMDPHFRLDRLRRFQADGEAVRGFAQGRFPGAAGTGDGRVAVNGQVDE